MLRDDSYPSKSQCYTSKIKQLNDRALPHVNQILQVMSIYHQKKKVGSIAWSDSSQTVQPFDGNFEVLGGQINNSHVLQ